jgi:glycerophosphoryl diester phosphodiesterase
VTAAQAPFTAVDVVGHRGSGRSGLASGVPENTQESFAAAVAAGATWIETDARLTLDGHLVLAHDLAISGRQVGLMTLDEALAAGAVEAPVLDELPPSVGVDLEVKTSLFDIRSTGTHAAAVEFIRRRRDARPWLLSSFDCSLAALAGEAGVPFGLLSNRAAWLYESVATAARLGAQVVKVHEASFWHCQEGHPPVTECLAAGRTVGMQLMVWEATGITVGAAAGLGLDAVCVDDVVAAVLGLTGRASVQPPVAVRPPAAGLVA